MSVTETKNIPYAQGVVVRADGALTITQTDDKGQVWTMFECGEDGTEGSESGFTSIANSMQITREEGVHYTVTPTFSRGGVGASNNARVTTDMLPVQDSRKPIASDWAYNHAADLSMHNSPENAAKLEYVLRNYGPSAPLPAPGEHGDDAEHSDGVWTYLTDTELATAGYFREADVKSEYGGKWPVYGVILPWYNQRTGSADTRAELYTGSIGGVWGSEGGPAGIEDALPDCCDGMPWLFDALITDPETHEVRPRRWQPATLGDTEPAVDEWREDALWKWWDVNYLRTNFGNRRITAVKQALNSTFAETGNVDVGVAYHKRYIFCGRVEALCGGVLRDFTLLLIAGGPMTDADFPEEYAEFLTQNFTAVDVDGTRLPSIELKLWRECQHYEYDEDLEDYTITPAPYGLHSKYQSVLGGSGWSGLKPRSQQGHMLTGPSHNQHVSNSSTVTDGVKITDADGEHTKTGYTDYHRKGGGHRGSGMDRLLFIGLHMMMKTGSKNLQKYMRGVVDSDLELHIPCAMSTADAQAADLIDSGNNVCAVVKSASVGNLRADDFVAVGASGLNFNTATEIFGRVVSISEQRTHTPAEGDDINYKVVVIEPWAWFGKTHFTHTAAQYLNRVLPPCGVTEGLGQKDGSPYKLLGTGSSACRFFGTEFGMGAMNINMDTVEEFKTGNLMQLWQAQPWQERQTSTTGITEQYRPAAPAAGFGKSGSYYGADLIVDVEHGTYYQTAPASGSGSSSTGLCDQVLKGNYTSGCYAYWAFGGAYNLAGATAGVWGAYCGNNGNNSALTNGNWYTCSCGFASKKFPFCLRIRGCNMPPGNPPALRLAA